MSPDPLRTARLTRRTMLAGTAGALGALALPGTASATPVDWSRAVVDSTMKRFTPATLGGWGYTRGLYLYGQYLVYRRTGERRYLDYILAWYDRFVTEGGIASGFTNLDAMRSGQMFPLLYTETGQAKYKTAAEQLRGRFPSYPRTSDGGMFHATSKTGQLWADGVYMAQPFLALYGKTFGDPGYCYEEAAKNVIVYFDRLKEPATGLLYHAYDEDGSEPWASGDGRHSKFHWARAIGWLGMTAIDLLEILPGGHPRRKRLVEVVKFLAAGYTRWQDRASGRWFQIVDRGGDQDNWLETSASAMYTFLLSRGVERGHLGPEYRPVAAKGHRGVLSQISAGADGLADIKNISEGTNVGDTAYYYARKRNTNDFHGLGAFLIMNEQLAFPGRCRVLT
ncbi:glycoside hydrolase family 105 protein [Amycolatopsis sp. lyj-90]|uniref:glycoside hydrolase family 88/105 protein n=1 Tax=Amycolatopsis sp. lyj-90 TaxID=2789285 RepID=UPI00397DC7CC